MAFIYDEILANLGWFSTYPFKKLGDVNYVHPIGKQTEIDEHTTIAYYPGCFAEFHEGHVGVIKAMKKHLEELTDDYVIVVAPANSDYTVAKYGADNICASNKYRFDKICKELEGFDHVMIDLNPMLNNDRDYNFTDLLKDFVERYVKCFDDLHHAPYIMGGKDREYFKNLEKVTKKIKVFYGPDQTGASSSSIIKQNPKVFVKKTCLLRCNNFLQFDLFSEFFGDQYKEVRPIYLEDELELAEQLAKSCDVTICKEYSDFLPYVKLSRNFVHPLMQSSCVGDVDALKGKVILDSDIYTGGTKAFVNSLGSSLLACYDVSASIDEIEIVDIMDFYDDDYCYPKVDIASRCSMKPFTRETHQYFDSVKKYFQRHVSKF